MTKDKNQEPIQNEAENIQNNSTPIDPMAEKLEAALRQLADSQNTLRHAENNAIRAHHDGIADLILAILPAIDNLKRAITSETESDVTQCRPSVIVIGLTEVLKEFETGFAKFGVQKINALGQPFNAEKMNFITSEGKGDKVIRIEQDGYEMKIGDETKNLRIAQVIVG